MKRARKLRTVLSAAAVLGTLSGAIFPGPEDQAPTDALLKKLEMVFRKETPGPLRDLCSPRNRLYLSLPGSGIPDGYVSPDQLRIHLEGLFSRWDTIDFGFLSFPPPAEKRTISRTARWEVRTRDREVRRMTLRFQFSQEGRQWFLDEIRAVR